MGRLRIGAGNDPEIRARTIEWQRKHTEELARMIERGECPAGDLDRQWVAWCVRESAKRLDATPKRGRGAPRHKTPDDDSLALLVAVRIAKGEKESEARAAVAHAFDIEDVSTLNKRIKHCLDDAKQFLAGAHVLGRRSR